MKNKPALMTLITVVMMALLTVSCRGRSAVGKATYDIHVEGDGNEVSTETELDSVFFEIISERGIGAASFEVVEGVFPSFVGLNLHLKGLEELRFTYGETEVLVSVSSSQGNAIRESLILISEGMEQETPITADSPYWMDVEIYQEDGSPGTIPLEGGLILVAAPEDFLSGNDDSFQIQWIDFYR